MGFDFIKKKFAISIPSMLKFRPLKMQETRNFETFLQADQTNFLQSSVLVQQTMRMLYWITLQDYARFRKK